MEPQTAFEIETMADPLAPDPASVLRNVFDAMALATPARPGLAPGALRSVPASQPAAVRETSFDTVARLKASAPAGFTSLSQQVNAMARRRPNDPRITAMAEIGMSEGLGVNGGVLVQPELATPLIRAAFAESLLAPLCDRRRNSRGRSGLDLPAIDETSREDGSRWGGTRAYWDPEGNAAIATQPRYSQLALRPKKLHVLVFASEELMADGPAMEDHLKAVFQAEGGFALDRAIIAGSGMGEPTGFLHSEALITVPKETAQAAATIVPENVSKMWKRMPVGSRRKAIWIVNEDAESSMMEGLNAEKFAPIYQPAGTGGSPFPLLYGRPVVAMEQASPLGQVGDISVVDLSQYVLLELGSKTLLSIHVKFVEDQVAVKFVWRGDGAPGWRTPVLSANGSGITRSPFVTLAARE